MHALKVAKFQFILERDLNQHMTAKIIHLKIILKAFSHTLTDWRKLLRFKKILVGQKYSVDGICVHV